VCPGSHPPDDVKGGFMVTGGINISHITPQKRTPYCLVILMNWSEDLVTHAGNKKPEMLRGSGTIVELERVLVGRFEFQGWAHVSTGEFVPTLSTSLIIGILPTKQA
jgi:hypothetical protein